MNMGIVIDNSNLYNITLAEKMLNGVINQQMITQTNKDQHDVGK